MVVKISILLCALMLLAAKPVVAFDATPEQDLLVEQGAAFYDDEDYAKAKAILLPLAEAGHPKAMHYVGRMHEGTNVFPRDPKIECDWYEKAANAGYVASMYNMSVCYDGYGRADMPEIDQKWLLQAAENNFIPAMINLAGQDQAQGNEYRQWMNKASHLGSVYAKVSLRLQGYEQDAPDVYIQDTLCVYVRILLLDGDVLVCD